MCYLELGTYWTLTSFVFSRNPNCSFWYDTTFVNICTTTFIDQICNINILIHEATLFCFVASNIWETFPSAFKKLHLSFNHFYKQYQLTSSQLIPNLFVKFNLTVFYSEFCPCFINFYFLLHCIVFVWKVNVSFKIYKRPFRASFLFYFLF